MANKTSGDRNNKSFWRKLLPHLDDEQEFFEDFSDDELEEALAAEEELTSPVSSEPPVAELEPLLGDSPTVEPIPGEDATFIGSELALEEVTQPAELLSAVESEPDAEAPAVAVLPEPAVYVPQPAAAVSYIPQPAAAPQPVATAFVPMAPVPPAQPTSAPATKAPLSAATYVPVPPQTKEEADWAAQSAQLAEEERRQRLAANAALEEVKRTEAALRRSEKETAYQHAELKLRGLQTRSSAAQAAAAAALQDLTAVEEGYQRSVVEADQSKAAEQEAHAACDTELATLAADNQARLAVAGKRIEDLAAEIKERRLAAAAASAQMEEAKQQLAESETQLRDLHADCTSRTESARKKAEQIRAEAAAIGRQIEAFETRLAAEQEAYDESCAQLAAVAEQLHQAEDRVVARRQAEEDLVRQGEEALTQRQTEDARELAAYEEELSRQRQRRSDAVISLDTITAQLADLRQQQQETEQQLRQTKLERNDEEVRAKEHIARIMANIDRAKQEVSAKKSLYQEAQQKVEQATADLVGANALAKDARARLELAHNEEKDAQLAADTAQRLQADAIAARNNGDDASSALLDRAESVLQTTIDSTTRLLEEKSSLRQTAEEENRRLQAAAAEAVNLSNSATAAANDMIVVWLAAEEAFVKTTNEVEAERRQAESEQQVKLSELDERISALNNSLSDLEGRIKETTAAFEAAKEEDTASAAAVNNAERRLEQLQDEQTTAQREQRQRQESRLEACREDLASLQTVAEELNRQHLALSASNDTASQLLQAKLAEYNSERERLQGILSEKLNDAADQDQQAQDCQNDADSRSAAIQQLIAQLNSRIQAASATMAAEQSAAERVEHDYNEARSDLETMERAAEAEMEELRQEHQRRLQPLIQARENAENQRRHLAEEFGARRQRTEEAVRQAAAIFIARLEAAGAVSVKKVETEIVALKEAALPLYSQAQTADDELAQAEETYTNYNEEATRLRGEEERINSEADRKYHNTDTSKTAQLNAKETELRQAIAAADERLNVAVAAEQHLTAAKAAREAAAAACAEAERQRDAAVSAVAERLELLQQQHDEALSGLGLELPALQQAAEEAATVAQQQRTLVEENERTYGEQAAQVDARLQEELAGPKDAARAIEEMRQSKQQALNDAHTRLAALEAKEKELQGSYASSCECADRADQAKANVEEYLERIISEQEAQQQEMESRIASMQQRVAQLKDDANYQEQLFRETERMLLNSNTIIENAEAAYAAAQFATAKALAELRSSQSARETANALAQQASTARDGMDKTTADILMKAAEGLFSAVENAETVIKEKQAQYERATAAEADAAAQRDQVLASVGEAPAQLESSRSQWEKAEALYQQVREESEQAIATLRKNFDAYVEAHRADREAATESVNSCRAEAASRGAAVEKLSRRLMDLAAEISAAAGEVQSLEIDMADATAVMEADADQAQSLRRQARVEAQQSAAQLGDQLEQLRAILKQMETEAEATQANYAEALSQYHLQAQRIENTFEADCLSAREDQRAAVEAAERASSLMVAAMEAENIASNEHHSSKLALTEASMRRECLSREYELLRQEREAALKACEEEKLRLLGSKTIQRIKAEEKAARAQTICQSKRSIAQVARRKVADIEENVRAAEAKLEKTRAEGERDLKIARTKTSIFA